MANALFMRIAQEGLKRRPVALNPVRPIVAAKHFLSLPRKFVAPGDWKTRCGKFERACDAPPLGLLERFEQAHSDPRVSVKKRALHGHHMHDRKNTGLAIVLRLYRHMMLEQPGYIRMSFLETSRGMGRQNGVNLAPGQHLAQALCWCGSEADAWRQIEWDLFGPARLVDTGLDPINPPEVDAIFMDHKAAGIYGSGLGPLRHADALGRKIFGLSNRPVTPDIDRGMAEDPRWEYRDRC